MNGLLFFNEVFTKDLLDVLISYWIYFLCSLLLQGFINPILHTAWLEKHALWLTLERMLQIIILVKNLVFCVPS